MQARPQRILANTRAARSRTSHRTACAAPPRLSLSVLALPVTSKSRLNAGRGRPQGFSLEPPRLGACLPKFGTSSCHFPHFGCIFLALARTECPSIWVVHVPHFPGYAMHPFVLLPALAWGSSAARRGHTPPSRRQRCSAAGSVQCGRVLPNVGCRHLIPQCLSQRSGP